MTAPIKSSTQIAERITEAMLAPGTRLGERQLAELFGVSPTQIREALARLVRDRANLGRCARCF